MAKPRVRTGPRLLSFREGTPARFPWALSRPPTTGTSVPAFKEYAKWLWVL